MSYPLRLSQFQPRVTYQLLSLPSFGRSRDITRLIDPSERGDYVNGVLTSGFVVWACFIAWAICLIACKWIGKTKVGFLSGKLCEDPVERPPDSDEKEFGKFSRECDWDALKDGDDDVSTGVDLDLVGSSEAAPTSSSRIWLYYVFIGKGSIFFGCLALLFAQGLLHTHETIDIAASSSSQVQYIAHESYMLIHETVPAMTSLIFRLREGLQLELDMPEFCPANPSLDDTWLASQIREYAYDILNQLDTLGGFLSFDTENTGKMLQLLLEKDVTEVADWAGSIDTTGFVTIPAFVLLALVPVLLMAAALLAYEQVWFPVFDRAVRRLLIPLLVIFVAAAWSLLVLNLSAATIAVDFCLPSDDIVGSSPDRTVLRALQAMHQHPSGMVYQFAEHIISGCSFDAEVVMLIEAYRFRMVCRNHGFATQIITPTAS
jgi:hypothetical protein